VKPDFGQVARTAIATGAGSGIGQAIALGIAEVAFNVFETPGTPGQKLVTYSPLPGSGTAEKFALLASWAASHDNS
jgi:hypothetical protein